jgi:hypothetical protein
MFFNLALTFYLQAFRRSYKPIMNFFFMKIFLKTIKKIKVGYLQIRNRHIFFISFPIEMSNCVRYADATTNNIRCRGGAYDTDDLYTPGTEDAPGEIQ